MTRIEIQKRFKQICPPRHGEKQSFWFSRLARQLGWTTERVQSLWKDDRCKLSFEEGLSLRNTSGSTPSQQIITKNLSDLEDLKEFKKQIRKEILNELVGTFQKLVEADAR